MQPSDYATIFKVFRDAARPQEANTMPSAEWMRCKLARMLADELGILEVIRRNAFFRGCGVVNHVQLAGKVGVASVPDDLAQGCPDPFVKPITEEQRT